jgi:hypothetical protein
VYLSVHPLKGLKIVFLFKKKKIRLEEKTIPGGSFLDEISDE